MRIEVKMCNYEGFEVQDVIQSCIELDERCLKTSQIYYSKEKIDNEITGITTEEYYTSLEETVRLEAVVGVKKYYMRLDDVWQIKISSKDGDNIIFTVATESEATSVYEQLNKIIFQ